MFRKKSNLIYAVHITMEELFLENTKMEKMQTYQVGKRKNVWKNVLIPSISSCSMSANPNRKKARCRFLSCGQRVFQAEIIFKFAC